ncbi:hypothetical protein AVEN_91643-1 [Araneus ventricosus]|uniref:Uncharacterized protein n=1 Tax=Araneus ventricosus TaxID=182803 RepID=A0A4Y2EZ01_ARAVE|nr:hypothetical protein AVEN_91643-1 [Araneus ventricosus]
MERTLRGWREGIEMDLSGGRGFSLSTTRAAYRSNLIMKIESAPGSDSWTSFDSCSPAGTVSTLTCGLFSLSLMEISSKKMGRVIQLAMNVRCSRSTKMILPYSPGLQTLRS